MIGDFRRLMNTVLPGGGTRARCTDASPARRIALGRLVLAGVLLGGLAGCAGSDPLASLAPPQTHVPDVAEGTFPSVGTTTAPNRREPLTTEGQQKLQKDLESAAKKQARTSSQAASGD